MHISGTFLNSKIAKRIALILFLAAFIPTALITGLTHNTVSNLVTNHSHKELVVGSHNYALSVFTNLTFARTNLISISGAINEHILNEHALAPKNILVNDNKSMFRSLLLITPNGQVLDKVNNAQYYGDTPHKNTIMAAIKGIKSNKSKLVVLTKSDNNEPTILLIIPKVINAHSTTLLIGEINQKYLWGNPEDFPSDTNICAYSLNGNSNNLLFCSDKHSKFQDDTEAQNIGEWELFLRGEFDASPWMFVTQRQFPLSTSPLGDFLSSYGYIGAAVFSLLMVALLSLIEIRRTMVPLEKLVDSTRKISQGKFTQVQVEGKSEFSELAESFNNMSVNIKRQLDTLQSLSAIDRKMVSNLDVDQIINQVIIRTQSLIPSAIICVTSLDEVSDNETQCSISTSNKISLISPRIAISNEELDVIRTYSAGHFGRCKKDDRFIHENFLAELNANYFWILPIFWQGEMCAFISISDEIELPKGSTRWIEISELAGRIGIAISAQAREDKLLTQAQYDNLTGLPNRILLQDRLRQAIEHSDRSSEPFWLVFIDLDRFKFINDTLGHKAGDQLLSEVAKRLQWTIRDTDTVARFGGDEFIVILQGEMNDNLRIGILNRLIQAVEAPFAIEGHEIITTCSAGVSVYPADGKSADTLLSNADIAMYRAKELGKNNYQFFTQSMNNQAKDRLRLETHLRSALDLNEFEVFYQPKVNMVTKKIVGMEALLRWNNHALGFISPAQFIPLAEESGLITSIGEWVLKTACVQAVAWRNAGLGDLVMAVNLSARQFGQKNLVGAINDILVDTGMDAQLLELELTESMMMEDADGSRKTLQQIKSLGVHLSIDDFGTGYSSLSYLKNLPVSTLKIDKSFTDDIVLHSDEAPIVASIIALAKNLKLNVVAEGVETYEQVRYLSAHGCNEIQGYYFSKPDCAETIEILLKQKRMLEAPKLSLVEAIN
jgi:diguanylate cyclase (GGDEF)-like protein